MSTAITFPLPDGATYIIPAVDDENWGQNVSNFLIAIPNGVMPRSGNYAFTGDVSITGGFGFVLSYLKSITTNPATAGTIRLAKTDTLDWRNNANSANLPLAINGSDQLTFNGTAVTVGGVTSITGTAHQIIASASTGAVTLSTPQNIDTTSSPTFASLILTAPLAVIYGGTGVTTSTGSGSNVLSTSPTLVTPALGTPSAVVLTNGTSLPLTTGVTGTLPVGNGGTGVTSLGTLSDAGTDGIVVTGGANALITSASLAQHVSDSTHNGYLSSTDWTTFNSKQAAGNYITALSGDVTATGPGVVAATLATVNASPGTTTISTITTNGKGLVTANSSATTTGSGSVVLATSPTLVTPNLGTPSTLVLTSATGLPLTTGVTGTLPVGNGGTGVTTSTGTGNNVLSNSPTLVTPALGTPSALVLTNATGLPVAGGGTGAASFTAYAVITGGTTSTGALQNVSGVGTSGQVLTSNGAAALPTWQTIATGSGTVNSGTANHLAYYATSTNAVSDMGTNFTYSAGTMQNTGILNTSGAAGVISIQSTSLGLTFNNGGSTSTIINTPTSSRTFTIPDVGANASFVMTQGTQTISGTTTLPAVPSINSTFIGLGRNRIINGDMTIDQRNAGGLVTINSGVKTYGVDRFHGIGTTSAGVFKTQQLTTTPPTGFIDYTHVTVTTADASPAAGSIYNIGTPIEGNNVRDFLLGSANAVSFTLSFWVKSSSTGTYGGSFVNNAQNRSYVFSYTINSANTWEQKSVSLTGDTSGTWLTDTNIGLWLFWDLGSGSTYQHAAGSWNGVEYFTTSGNARVLSSTSNTWDITGVQLEIGSTATSFEYVSMPQLMTQCERYYEKSYPLSVIPGTNTVNDTVFWPANLFGTGQTGNQQPLRTTKRAAPTITTYDRVGASGKIATFTAATTIANGVTPTVTAYVNGAFVSQSTTATATFHQYNYTADADF